jgi:hypothetical protein
MKTWLALILSVAGAGCYSRAPYLVEPSVMEMAVRLPEAERATKTAPARRADDLRPVQVRLDALRLADAKPGPGGALLVPTRAYSPMITAGSALTWIGTVISITGTTLAAAYHFDLGTDGGRAGVATAITAEPIMLIGTLLWTFSDRHRPQEAPDRINVQGSALQFRF